MSVVSVVGSQTKTEEGSVENMTTDEHEEAVTWKNARGTTARETETITLTVEGTVQTGTRREPGIGRGRGTERSETGGTERGTETETATETGETEPGETGQLYHSGVNQIKQKISYIYCFIE